MFRNRKKEKESLPWKQGYFFHNQPNQAKGNGNHQSSSKEEKREAFRLKGQWIRWAAMSLLAVVLVVCGIKLVSYGHDYLSAKHSSAALRALYYSQEEPEELPVPTEQPLVTAAPEIRAAAEPTRAPVATATPPVLLAAVPYPDNPRALISNRFEKIRRQNKDIVGWLAIDGLLDEAVVQRDNVYYLDRDYRGYHNVNGAIFLDENCQLDTRPYTMLLFGHNMKTGAMFGGLRNYENLSFYKKNPFVTFDTAYEDGRFVIFAVSNITTRKTSWRYMNFSFLCSSIISLRQEALEKLLSCSCYSGRIPVSAEDQVVLLITCVENDDERRVIAARRIRPGETEEELMESIQRTRKKEAF